MSLQQYNGRLQSDLESTNESHKQLEREKATIVENLSTVRGHNKALQDELASVKVALQDQLASVKVSQLIVIYVFPYSVECFSLQNALSIRV